MRHLFAILLVILISATAWAETTVAGKSDARLDQKVTIEVVHTKLADVVADLSKQTGVSIKAGTNTKDWKPRERKVTIFAKDVPAGELMNQIADLLGYQLTSEGKQGAWKYTFWQDRKSRQEEDLAVAAEEKAKEDEGKKLRQSILDVADDALGMTPAAAMAKKDSSPWIAFLGGTDTGRSAARILSYFNKMRPDERSLFLTGKTVRLDMAGLPADIQQAARDVAQSPVALLEDRVDGGNPRDISYLVFSTEAIDGVGFMEGDLEFHTPTKDRYGRTSVSRLLIVNEDPRFSKYVGEAALAVDSGRPPSEVTNEMHAQVGQLISAEGFLGRESPTEKDLPTDPELTREIEIKEFPSKLLDPNCGPADTGPILKEVARATGWPLLFESFDRLNALTPTLASGKQPLYKVLIALEKTGYLWERDQDILRVRPDDWRMKRAGEISEEFAAYYKQLYEKQSKLTLDDIAELVSSLTDYQILNSLEATEIAGLLDRQITGRSSEMRGFLRLINSLSPEQRTASASGSGLPLAQLDSQQRKRVEAILGEREQNTSVAECVIGMITPSGHDASPGLFLDITEQGKNETQRLSYHLILPSPGTVSALKRSPQ